MRNILWSLVAIGAVCGAFVVFVTLSSSNGSPQEAAGCAIGISFALLPYVLARSFDELKK